MILLDLSVHVLAGHYGNKCEEESDDAECSEEVEFTLDEGNHGYAAVLVETAVVLGLFFNWNLYILFPD